MVLNNVPPLTETRARPAMRFSSSNFTYSIWTQRYRATWAGSTCQINSSACLGRKAIPQESRAAWQGTRKVQAELAMLPAPWLLPSQPCPSVFPAVTIIVKKEGSVTCRSPVFHADLIGAVPRGRCTRDAGCCSDSPQASCLQFIHRSKSKMR